MISGILTIPVYLYINPYVLIKKGGDVTILRRRGISQRLALSVATCLGLGYLPICPGTFASSAALGAYVLLGHITILAQLTVISLIFFIGVWSAGVTEHILGIKDPHQVVIDEVAGYMMTTILLPFTFTRAFLGLFLFRLFDILKPFPIKKFERIQGGWGIMADDIIAGLYSMVILRLLLTLGS